MATRSMPVKRGQPLARIHYNADARLEEASRLLRGAYRIGSRVPRARRLTYALIRS